MLTKAAGQFTGKTLAGLVNGADMVGCSPGYRHEQPQSNKDDSQHFLRASFLVS